MSDPVRVWWWGLCGAALVNVVLWTLSARSVAAGKPGLDRDLYANRRLLLWLSAAYVLGCAFRSFHPMIDAPRLCLHDAWLARVAVARSVATIAEICFVMQWAVLLREANAAVRHPFAAVVGRTLVPLIVLAEVASWLAVLTTNNVFHALENSLWTLAAALTIAACATLRSLLDDQGRRFMNAAIACGGLYIVFMITVDVPMYVSRWLEGLTDGRASLTLLEGFREIAERCRVSRDWTVWREDAIWLTLYFTAAVWLSILLPHVPPFRGRPIAASPASLPRRTAAR
jgi:hypothetical protein